MFRQVESFTYSVLNDCEVLACRYDDFPVSIYVQDTPISGKTFDSVIDMHLLSVSNGRRWQAPLSAPYLDLV